MKTNLITEQQIRQQIQNLIKMEATTNSDLSDGTDNTNTTDSTDGSASNDTDNSGTTEPETTTDNSGTAAQ